MKCLGRADLIRRVLSAIARMATEEGNGMIDWRGVLSRMVDKAWATDHIRLGGDGLLDSTFQARTSASSVEALSSSGPSEQTHLRP
jgi:hypothetical protein